MTTNRDPAPLSDRAGDRSDIVQLLAEYAHAVDGQDFDAVAACFLADASASYGGRELGPGVEHIVDHIRGVANFVSTQHLFGVPLIHLDGDTATATSHAISYLVEEGDAGQTVLGRGLTYDDESPRLEVSRARRTRRHRQETLHDGVGEGVGPELPHHAPACEEREMARIVALVVLVLMVLGLAYHIEITARPPTGKQGVHRTGGHDH